MNQPRATLFGIASCLAGLLALAVATVVSAWQIRETTWLLAFPAAGALLFGALCVLTVGLIRRRLTRPPVNGDDELSRIATDLDDTLDQRDAADAQRRQGDEQLQSALTELAATRDSLARAQAIARIGSWEFGPADDRLEWSDQLFEIYGVRREDFGGTATDFFDLLHPEDRQWFLQRRQEWLDSGGELDVEHRIVRPDGDVRWIRQKAHIIEGRADGQTFTSGTVQDITERHGTEERLRHFQKLLEGSEDLCAVVDDSYRFLWVNPSYAKHYRLDPDRVHGLTLTDVLGEPYFEEVIRPRVDRALAGEAQRFETTRDLPGLPSRRMLARYYPIDVPRQACRRVGAVITDITGVRKTEAEVARQGRLLDMAGRAARFGAWSIDLETGAIEWSDVVAEIHGMPKGHSPSLEEGLSFYAPEYRERIRSVFAACAEEGRPYDEELQIIDANGQRRWVRTVGDAVRDDRGRIIRVQGAFQDISPRKELEHETSRLTERMATMLDSITDGFVAFDHEWRYTYVNAEAEHLLGKSSGELLGTTVWSQFPGLAGTQSERALQYAMRERVSSSAEELFEPLDAWFEMRTYPWEEGVAAYFRDVTENHRMLERLRAQEAALRASRDELDRALTTRQALINSLPAHIAMLDAEGVIIDVNEQWRHFGEQNAIGDADFGVGSNYIMLCETASGECADESAIVARGLRDVLAGRRETFALEYPCHSAHEERWFRAMFNRLSTGETGSNGAVAMHIDITERKLAEREIERLAYRDQLTDALSRNGFVRRLGEQLAQRDWPEEGVLAIIDVINQHDINDAHGYDTGDRLLVALSRRLLDLAGERGLVGRSGGDEFVVYLPVSTGESVNSILDRLEQTVDAPFRLNGERVTLEIGLRVGYTRLGDQRRSTENLIREAELALLEHRRNASAGTTRIAFTRDLMDQAGKRLQLTHELRHALDAEEFELHFQPKVALADGSMISAEALIRWRHPERGLLSPGLFIPVAEQSQLIGPIGDWALRAACRQLSEWRRNDLDAVRVAVNVSQVQFMLGDFSAKVRSALEEFGVAPEHLSLEITESVFERHSDRLLSEIRELKKLGVRLSLDDFGTGYSSLLYLQRYPFDEIKIDRGFVDRILEDRYSRDIVQAVINLARALDAEVVAEGIESSAIAAALLEMGCLEGQGFYYSVPLESEDFRWLLHQRSKLPLVGSGGE